MEKVKKMVRAGSSIPTAIKEALSQAGCTSVAAFAEKHGLVRASVANHINGTVRATDDTIAALVEELGGTPDEWRELLWLAAKPTAISA
jgi:plasmid maintenance system antidote protein VapI